MIKISKIAPLVAAVVALSGATAALAQTNVTGSANTQVNVQAGGTSVGANAQVNIEARITKGKERAGEEIERRIKMLTDLNTRVQAMAHVSASEKTDIQNTVNTQISTLTSLKAKIDADSDFATLKTDIQSITKAYRIFMLVIPRGRIDVAADKINAAASALTTLSDQLQARITSASGNTSAAVSALTDMNAKIADAQTQANAAVSAVANLQPDNGDKTTEASNNAALKNARGKIHVALADIKVARKDAGDIVKALKQINASAQTNTSAGASTQ